MYDEIKDCLPNDHSRQITSRYYINLLARTGLAMDVLDLGCGDGRSVDIFRSRNPKVRWKGLDIEGSPEVSTRSRSDADFFSYNGTEIPFENETFDIVYSHQVFEHIRYPEKVLAEIERVLRPGGSFIGSVSTLEPYHSYSFWNYTPYGWYILLGEAGLKPIEFRPGIDSIALITRQYKGRPPEARGWFDNSPLNAEIDDWAKKMGRRTALSNLRKVHFCGHLCFYAQKSL